MARRCIVPLAGLSLAAVLFALPPAAHATQVQTAPTTVTTTDKSGSITTGGTAQTAIAANLARKTWCIQNDPAATETLWERQNGTAAPNVGVGLAPGAQVCNSPGLIDTSVISVFGATTGHKWSGSEQQ